MASVDITGRIPPHNDEAERALLGAILLDSKVFFEVSAILIKDDFYKIGHQDLYQAMLALNESDSSKTIDLISLTAQLKKDNLLDRCGGMEYIYSLTDNVPSTTNSVFYAKLIKTLAMRRNLLKVANQLRDNSFDESQDIKDVVDEGENLLSLLASKGNVAKDYKDAKDLLIPVINDIEKRTNGDVRIGLQTGFTLLDKFLSGGIKDQEYVVIGARPSIGKTAFALTVAINMVVRNNYRVGFLSLEMSANSLVERALAGVSRTNFGHIRTGILKNEELNQLINACDILSTKELYIQDTPNMEATDVRTQARKMKREKDIQILFIDYIGLIQSASNNAAIPRHEQIATISRMLKQLTRELNIPIVVLSQVGRQTDGALPKLSDLRESGAIEQDADVVLLLHRKSDSEDLIQDTELLVAKNRNGATGKIHLGFNKEIVRFEELVNDMSANK
ncbi:MAG: replicative DNA helicase [Sphaerochaetaceae bacterium]|nr:replicative DNA helicase [Sphaerochaetaceae bacterium]